ncbi:hypothetical protein FOZ60_005861 [Perkinsus olseni]|uniref:Uncharacterized protein n=1 Tax=Perkinsus olseni TaxID=32597 RepID=A0A7J6PFY8_PEROL|nr:hypothetical protein FOZ60_005861 [Perkinsus olseni]
MAADSVVLSNPRVLICLLAIVTALLCLTALSCTVRRSLVYYTWAGGPTVSAASEEGDGILEACTSNRGLPSFTDPLKLVRKAEREKWSKNFAAYSRMDHNYANISVAGSCRDPAKLRWVSSGDCEHGNNVTLPRCISIKDEDERTEFSGMIGRVTMSLTCPCRRMTGYTGSGIRRILRTRAAALGTDKVQLVFVGESVFREVFSTLVRVLNGGELPLGFDHRLQTRRHGHISYTDADVELYFYFLGGVYPYPLLDKKECPKTARTGRSTKLTELCGGPMGVWRHILDPAADPLYVETDDNHTERVFPHDISRTALVAYGAGVWDAAYCGNPNAFGREFRSILRLIRDSGLPLERFLVRNIGAGFGTDEHVKENTMFNRELLSSVRDVFGDSAVQCSKSISMVPPCQVLYTVHVVVLTVINEGGASRA